MSTKTTFKRIALVAVAALGLGVLSVVPSQAAAGTITLAVVQNGTASLTPATGTGETATGVIITVESLLTAGNLDSLTVSFLATGTDPASSIVKPVMTFLDSTSAASGKVKSKIGSTTSTAYAAGESVTATNDITLFADSTPSQLVGAKLAITLESSTAHMSTRKAGTYNYLVVAQGYTAGQLNSALTKSVAVTIRIDAAAVAAKAIPAAANATTYVQAKPASGSAVFTAVLADSATSGSLVAGTEIGSIQVKNKTSLDAVANDTITVLMTGVGYLVTTAGPASAITGNSFVVTEIESLTAKILADGRSGTGTITITTGAGASFVKTVTFYDTKPSKAVATVAKAYIKAGTAEVGKVFSVVVTDTALSAITNATVTAAPTDTATTVGGAATCSYDTTDKVYYCGVKGLSTLKFGPVAYTIKATGTDSAATVVSTSATVTFADNVATKAVLAGPASGTPGATVEYTLTLTEKNGYPVADQTYGVSSEGGVLFSSAATGRVVSGWTGAAGPFLATDSFTAKSGVITSKGILPLAGTATGSWILVGDGLQTVAGTDAIDKTIGKTTLTVSTEVANAAADAATQAAEEAAAAAQDATDAALDATTAAEAAGALAQEAVDAVAELSAQVTTLIAALKKQITTLTNLVIKIQKKVKA
jgi:hypothetical protein